MSVNRYSRRRRQLRAAKRSIRRHRARVELALKQSPGAATPLVFGSASEPARDYGAFSREAYTKNVIAFRCVYLISRGLAALRWYVTQGDEDEEIENPKHPMRVLLTRPNLDQSWGMMMEAWSAFFLLSGNGYLLRKVPSTDERKPTPRAIRLDALRSDRMKVEHEKEDGGRVTGYSYTAGRKTTFYPRDPRTGLSHVLHLRSFNPMDDYYGLSAVEPAAFGIDQHNAAGEWNYKMLKNGARPSAVLEHDPGPAGSSLMPQQRKRLKKELRAKHQGSENVGGVLLLESYLKWKQMSFSPVDMDCGELKREAARDVATSYGVPPMLVGITGDATFANYKEARAVLWEDTILPHAQYLADALNWWLAPGFGENVQLHYDADKVPAIVAKQSDLWTMLNQAAFLGVQEKRAAAGYDEWTGENDVLLVPMGSVPLELGSGEENAPEPPPEAIEEIETDVGKAAEIAYGR